MAFWIGSNPKASAMFLDIIVFVAPVSQRTSLASQYSSLLLVAGFITKQLDRMLSAFAGYFCVIDFFILKFLLSLNLVDGSESCYVSFRKWRHCNFATSRKKLVDVFVVYGMNLYFLVFCFHIAFLSFIIVAKIR
nr:MAG TPA: hypothetical protein [Caudoviricetes sp.]